MLATIAQTGGLSIPVHVKGLRKERMQRKLAGTGLNMMLDSTVSQETTPAKKIEFITKSLTCLIASCYQNKTKILKVYFLRINQLQSHFIKLEIKSHS